MFADRQESLGDYAKWDQSKFYIYTLQDVYRVVMTGAGDSDHINMAWDKLKAELWGMNKLSKLKSTILRVVNEVTRKAIFPLPRDERSHMDLLWAIQPLQQQVSGGPGNHIQLFHTFRLSVVDIDTQYFTGSPRPLMQFLDEQYLRGQMIEIDAAESLSSYLLWEAKEHDLYVGKYSDIFTLRDDDSVGRLTPFEIYYWEDHWRQFKACIRNLPLLSCAVKTSQMYDADDHLKALSAAIKLLGREQKKMRLKHSSERTGLECKLNRELRRVAAKVATQRTKKLMRSVSQMAKQVP